MVDRGGDVDVLEMFEGFRVEEAECGFGRKGDLNFYVGNGYVRDYYVFFLVGFELVLGEVRRRGEGSGVCMRSYSVELEFVEIGFVNCV